MEEKIKQNEVSELAEVTFKPILATKRRKKLAKYVDPAKYMPSYPEDNKYADKNKQKQILKAK